MGTGAQLGVAVDDDHVCDGRAYSGTGTLHVWRGWSDVAPAFRLLPPTEQSRYFRTRQSSRMLASDVPARSPVCRYSDYLGLGQSDDVSTGVLQVDVIWNPRTKSYGPLKNRELCRVGNLPTSTKTPSDYR